MSAPATRRINRGSGHSYLLDGEPVDSVTYVTREGIPKPQFAESAARKVADYAVDHWPELLELSPSKRHATLYGARWADRNAAAVRGTAVHALADRLARGDEVDVPEALVGYVDAYLAFAEAYDVHELYVERPVIYRGRSRSSSYMGTFDILATFGDAPEVVLVDWKTAASGIWPETALQLSAYAHAQTILGPDDVEVELPPIARALAVWLRADGYDVYPVDISDATFRVFQYAQQVAHYRDAPREQYVGPALVPPERVGS